MPGERKKVEWRMYEYPPPGALAHAYSSRTGCEVDCSAAPVFDLTVPAPANVPRCPECERRVREEESKP